MFNVYVPPSLLAFADVLRAFRAGGGHRFLPARLRWNIRDALLCWTLASCLPTLWLRSSGPGLPALVCWHRCSVFCVA